jgi:hypothetical protein
MLSAREIGLNHKPQTIKYYSPKTSMIENRPTITMLTQFGMLQWLHGFQLSEERARQLTESNRRIIEAFGLKSLATEQKIAITPMPKGCLGHEAIAVEIIPQNSLLLYSGEFFSSDVDENYMVYFKDPKDNDDSGFSLCSKKHANISRFISHAYDEGTLHANLEFITEETAHRVATANFEGRYIPVGHLAIYALVAKRDILVGERLYWSYSKTYAHEAPLCLFDKDTQEVIDPMLYCQKNPTVLFEFNGERFPSGLQFINGVLNHEKENPTMLHSEMTERPYDLYILPRFVEEYVEHHPRCIKSVAANQSLIIPLPLHPHPCVKRLFPNQSLKSYLLDSINHILTPVVPFQAMSLMTGKKPGGSELIYFCKIKARSKGELYAIAQSCEDNNIGYFLSEQDDSVQLLRDDVFKRGVSPIPPKNSAWVNHSFLSAGKKGDAVDVTRIPHLIL